MSNQQDNKRKKRSRPPREEKEFEEYLLQLDRVTRVVKGGRRMRFRATVVIGDRAGRVGIGLGKGGDVQIATRKAVHDAQKKLIDVPIVNDTIPHWVKFKYKAARILILPAAPGTGLIAGGAVRKVLELAGVKNILSKNIGTSNRVTVGQAMLLGLAQLRMTESAKKFLGEMRKTREIENKKKAAARKESDGAGRRPSRGRRPEEKSELKQAVAKMEDTKGRLEQEMEAKK